MSTELSAQQRAQSLLADTILPWAAVVTAAALAVFVGRGLAPALPGSRAGIERWITLVETGTSSVPALGAWLTQTTLLSASWLCMHFSLLLLGQRSLNAPLRFAVTLLGAILFAIVALANVAQGQLGHNWLMAGASSALLLAALAAARALAQPATRAMGLVLLGSAGSGALQLGSRALALQFSSRARISDYAIAQHCASAALALTTATVLFALYWMWTSDRRRQTALIPLAVLPAVLITAAALASARSGVWWQQLAARTLSELRSHPDPSIGVTLRDATELCSLFLGVLVMGRTGTPGAINAVVGLALISRANVDVPLCALLLGCAALVGLTLSCSEQRGAPNNGSKKEQSRRADHELSAADPSLERAQATKIAAAGSP